MTPPSSDERNGNGVSVLATHSEPGWSASYAREREEDDSFQWHKLMAIVRRRRKTALATFAAILGLGAVYYALAPRIYQAQADLRISSPNSGFGSSLGDSLPAFAGLLDTTRAGSQETEAAILGSKPMQQNALKQLSPRYSGKGARAMHVDIRPLHSTEIISVVVSGRDKNGAIAYANAICDTYLRENQRNSSDVYRGTAAYVLTELKKTRDELDRARAAVRDYKDKHGVVDLSREGEARVKLLGDLTAQYQSAVADANGAQQGLASLQNQLPALAPEQEASRTLVQSPRVVQLRQQLTSLEAQNLQLRQEFTPTSPEVREVEGNIAALKAQLGNTIQSEVSSSVRQPNVLRTQVQSDISKTRTLILTSQARADALKQSIAQEQQKLRALPTNEFRLSQLQSDLAIAERTYGLLSDKYQTLRISQEAPSANARIIARADEAVLVSPIFRTTLLATLLLGLAAALGVAALLDRIDDRIFGEDDVRSLTGLPVLAQIPLLKNVPRPLIHLASVPPSLLESYRMLRTQLVLSAPRGSMKTILVTSSQPHEGKSTTASNIAIAMALNGHRVILVDCDLRRPHMHVNFEIDNSIGLTSVVAGVNTLEEALVDSAVEGLRLLPGGPMPPNPPELLDALPTRQLIALLRDMADVVILDSPPVLMMADAQIVATMADGVVLVVSAHEAKRHATERAVSLIEMTGARLLGIVLNKQDVRSGNYYGYYQQSTYALDAHAK